SPRRGGGHKRVGPVVPRAEGAWRGGGGPPARAAFSPGARACPGGGGGGPGGPGGRAGGPPGGAPPPPPPPPPRTREAPPRAHRPRPARRGEKKGHPCSGSAGWRCDRPRRR